MLEMNHTWVNMVTFVVDLNMWQLAEDANMLSEQLLILNPDITDAMMSEHKFSVWPAACWMCLASVLSVSAATCAAVLQCCRVGCCPSDRGYVYAIIFLESLRVIINCHHSLAAYLIFTL